MSSARAVERLRAWAQGRPLPLGHALPWPRVAAEDRCVLAFVRMAGESLPWGFALGRPDRTPLLFTVPDPRHPSALHLLAQKLWAALAPHMPHPSTDVGATPNGEGRANSSSQRAPPEVARTKNKVDFQRSPLGVGDRSPLPERGGAGGGVDVPTDLAQRRQLWVAGASHLELLHVLDYRFTPSRVGEPQELERLQALGRSCGWLFRESTRPGQARVFDATARLREVFAFPAEDWRQTHLGFLLAWLTHDGSRDERVKAAQRAESETVGTTLSPELERAQLAPLVEAWSRSRLHAAAQADIARRIEAVLRPELLRRFSLTAQALNLLDADPRPCNSHLEAVLELQAQEFAWQYWNREVRGAQAARGEREQFRFRDNHPETDRHPTAAASRYFAHLHAEEVFRTELAHGDMSRVAEALREGDAVQGRIEHVEDRGSKQSPKPFWTVVAPPHGSLKIRTGSEVCVVGLRGRKGMVRALSLSPTGRVLTIEIVNWKRARPENNAPSASDPSLEGTELTLLSTGLVGLSAQKSARVWNARGPGAWLTHASPRPAEREHGANDAELFALLEKIKLKGG